jgi:hypothetical protein
MTNTEATKKPKRYCTKREVTTLKKAVRVLGGRAIDRRTALGRALKDWRHSIIQDPGGVNQTSTQQRQVIDLAVKTKLFLDSIDAYLINQLSWDGSTVEEHQSSFFVVLRNINRMLADYRLRRQGILKRLKRWPHALEEREALAMACVRKRRGKYVVD